MKHINTVLVLSIFEHVPLFQRIPPIDINCYQTVFSYCIAEKISSQQMITRRLLYNLFWYVTDALPLAGTNLFRKRDDTRDAW